ncbi:beta-glucuronidase [Coraliomargarita sp. SDUM461004]|uniref:Beta-glucuronidase n=1 Tax=Thalassobacterium sedimentorum TaxID=3041258 RepID=A0ABU1AKI9_9BACT|nr:beta-glucuronidase [Coraliomargarita sp. SDUM461004]MDQ8195339.1 beta-glucuronidase [Coraliomargarita sp. SDUM461004]
MLFPQTNQCREIVNLDGLFQFAPNVEGDAELNDWTQALPKDAVEIAVPGSWNEQLRELHEFHGEGWYQRDFWAPAGWKGQRIRLRIGGTAGNAKVWVDGKAVGGHTGPHLPFEFDLSEFVEPGASHRLTIAVDNTLRYQSLPPGQARREEDRAGFGLGYPDVPYDFFPYGGIHRSVLLYATAMDSIENIAVETDYQETTGVVKVKLRLNGKSDGLSVKMNVDDQAVTLPVESNEVIGELTIGNVQLWSNRNPFLYTLKCELLSPDGALLDVYTLDIGVRRVEVQGDQLLLNGEPIFLKGFGKHEDFPILGKAWAPAVAVRDYDLMSWLGANSFRTSHYPYAEEMLSMADRLGFLVISETPFVSLSERVYTDDFRVQACHVIRELIQRDCNHPSVILWSLANEPYIESDAGERFFREMAETARACDSTRPIMYVAHEWPEQNRGAQHYDLLGVNKYYGWYHETGDIQGSLGKLVENLEAFHQQVKGPIMLAEFGADAVAGLHSDPPVLFSEEYQSDTIEAQYLKVRELPWVIGAHVWNFADFKTAQTINRVGGNKKGVFTRDRQPKLAARTLKRLWNDTDSDSFSR